MLLLQGIKLHLDFECICAPTMAMEMLGGTDLSEAPMDLTAQIALLRHSHILACIQRRLIALLRLTSGVVLLA